MKKRLDVDAELKRSTPHSAPNPPSQIPIAIRCTTSIGSATTLCRPTALCPAMLQVAAVGKNDGNTAAQVVGEISRETAQP